MFNSKEKLAMIARPSETPLTAKSLNTVLASNNSCVARPASLRLVEKGESLGRIPFGISDVDTMGFVGSKPWGDLDSPMLNEGADVEGCGHGAKRALELLLSHKDSKIYDPIHTASKGNAVEANHQRLRPGSQQGIQDGWNCGFDLGFRNVCSSSCSKSSSSFLSPSSLFCVSLRGSSRPGSFMVC